MNYFLKSDWGGNSQVFVESLDRAFENVCELDLVFHFDEVKRTSLAYFRRFMTRPALQVHHILAEIIQGGLVLETNVDEIDQAGAVLVRSCIAMQGELKLACFFSPVQEAARARKDSFTSSNPLSLGGGGLTPRGANMKTPLGWITGKLTGVGAR